MTEKWKVWKVIYRVWVKRADGEKLRPEPEIANTVAMDEREAALRVRAVYGQCEIREITEVCELVGMWGFSRYQHVEAAEK